MNLYIKLFGGALIMLSALLVGREYSKFVDKRIDEMSGFLSLIEHARGEISSYLAFGGGLFARFENEALEKCGFLPLLREGCEACDAFDRSSASLSLSASQRKDLRDFFSRFGSEYAEAEIEKTTAFLEKFKKDLERERENLTKSLSIARALLLGGALWAGIMAV